VNVEEFVFRAENPSEELLFVNSFPGRDFLQNPGRFSLPLLPFGEGWRISLESRSAGATLAIGRTVPLSLSSEENRATLFFAGVNAFHFPPTQPGLSFACEAESGAACVSVCNMADGSALLIGSKGTARFDPASYRFTLIPEISGRTGARCISTSEGTVIVGGVSSNTQERVSSVALTLDGKATLIDDPDGLLNRVGHQATEIPLASQSVSSIPGGTQIEADTAMVVITGGVGALGTPANDIGLLFFKASGEAWVEKMPLSGASAAALDGRSGYSAVQVLLPPDPSGPEGNSRAALLLIGGFEKDGRRSKKVHKLALSRQDVETTEMREARSELGAVRLANGEVLVAGGRGEDGQALKSSERFDPVTNSAFAPGPEMISPRSGHTMTLLQNGQVLIAGGVFGGESGEGAPPLQILREAELFDDTAVAGGRFLGVSDMRIPRTGHAALSLRDGAVLLVGGRGSSGLRAASDTVELFVPR
jgi:hypothetical protein